MANIMIIDDDERMCNVLCDLVKKMGHEVTYSLTLSDGFQRVSESTFDVVFLDVMLPDGNGLDILPKIRKMTSSPEVIIITGHGDPDGAELAIRNGAWDYIQKPSTIEDITLPLIRALQYNEEKNARKSLLALKRNDIIGSGPQMKVCLDFLSRAANSDANVLISGETGTGKEIFALAVHENSPRSNKSFVVVDCTALPETLVESILFGYERGAFTGADRNKEGLIKQSDGGTLFLDEVGELSLSIQKSFLRVIQSHCFRPLGSKQELKSNFRVVAATNQDLDQMVKHGKFRKDLLFRLRSLTLKLPPLREHPEDIKELALYYMAKLCKNYGMVTKDLSPEFVNELISYKWPGNVRELINVLEGSLAAARYENTLFPRHLPSLVRIQVARDSLCYKTKLEDNLEEVANSSRTIPDFMSLRKEIEKQYLQNIISFTERDIKKACQISGLSRSRLYSLLKKHKIS